MICYLSRNVTGSCMADVGHVYTLSFCCYFPCQKQLLLLLLKSQRIALKSTLPSWSVLLGGPAICWTSNMWGLMQRKNQSQSTADCYYNIICAYYFQSHVYMLGNHNKVCTVGNQCSYQAAKTFTSGNSIGANGTFFAVSFDLTHSLA